MEIGINFGAVPQILFSLFQAKEADLLVQNKALYEDKEQISQVISVDGLTSGLNPII